MIIYHSFSTNKAQNPVVPMPKMILGVLSGIVPEVANGRVSSMEHVFVVRRILEVADRKLDQILIQRVA